MRRAFTLIELLVIVAIIGAMVSVSALSIRASQGAVRVKGACRDIMAYIRHARSVALVTMKPAVVTYSTEQVDDEVCARIKVNSAQLTDSRKFKTAQTISGETVDLGNADEDEGESVEDVLFAPISDDVVKGVRLKVLTGDEALEAEETEKRRNKYSVFSNVDFLLGKFQQEQQRQSAATAAETEAAAEVTVKEDQEPVSFVWEVNGRCEPHRVYVYGDGDRPENGLVINVDRYGAMRVENAGEEDR